MTAIKNAMAGVRTLGYTATGMLADITDENGNRTTYQYNEIDRLVAVTDAKGARTSYVYDTVGNLTEIHQFAGVTSETINTMMFPRGISSPYQSELTEQVTKYKYDARGLLVEETNPGNKVTIYAYDANGNLTSKTDREGYSTHYEYDPVNNLKKITYDDGKQVEYEYNPLNQVIGMKDWLGKTTFEPDALGRLLKVKDYENRTTEYTWSSTGEKQSIKYPDASVVAYEYDLLGRLTSVNDAHNQATTYKYDQTGNVIEKMLPNGVSAQYQYDSLSRLTRLTNHSKSGKIIDDYKYSYDAAGNITKAERNKYNNELAVVFDQTQGLTQYKYDRLNQLIEVAKPNHTLEKYFYDTVGNRVRKENWVLGTLIDTSDYQYDIENKLTDINIQHLPLLGKNIINQSIKMEYDQRGNLVKTTSGETLLGQYTFDTANRLSAATNPLGIKSNFVYDGAGRRVKMQINLPKPDLQALKSGIGDIFGKNQASEKDICSWLYNGKDYKIEYNYVLDITEPYQNVLMAYGQGIDTQRYTFGLDIVSLDTWNKSVDIWTAETIAPVTSQKSDQNYYLQDELGSPIRIVGQAGNTKAIYSYDAFGRPILPVSFISQCRSKSNIYSYTGYQYDIPTGLMYAQARYYMPEAGRFISEDSVKGNLTNPVSLNSYAYVWNNPINMVDPMGDVPWTSILDFKSDWAGRDILWHYLYGEGKEVIIDNDKKWTDYMEHNRILTSSIKDLVKTYASQVKHGESKTFDITTSMEIDNGEQIIGYQYLHGTNADVGGFKIKGIITKDKSGNSTIKFAYQWNDRIDPNYIYDSDSQKAKFAKLIPFANPTDYTIRISWYDTSTLCDDGIFTSGWLSSNEPKRARFQSDNKR